MDFSISILKDAAAVIDKLVGAISKLGTAILNGTKNTVELVEFMSAYHARRALGVFTTALPTMQQRQILYIRPAMEDFSRTPTEAKWRELMRGVRMTREHVDEALTNLNKSGSILATEPVFVELVSALMARAKILDDLSGMSVPKTEDELAATRTFFTSYNKLIEELAKTGAELRKYVAKLQEKNIYPEDPPRRRRGQQG